MAYDQTTADLITENRQLRELLGKAAFWMRTEHCQEWWRGNDLFQSDFKAITEAAKVG